MKLKLNESTLQKMRSLFNKIGWSFHLPVDFRKPDGTPYGAIIGERVFIESVLELLAREEHPASHQESQQPSDAAANVPVESHSK